MRQLKDLINSYIEYVSSASESPECFNFWSIATAISANLKRHVYIDRGTYKLRPNLFTVLVGRPGLGKGAAINPVLSLLKESNTVNIMADRQTCEYILEQMSKGFPSQAVTSSSGIHFGTDSSILISAAELSVFISASQLTLPALNELWESKDGTFDYGTRTKGAWKIKDACVSLLGGSTASWLIDCLPKNSIGGGFTRRVNFVHAKDRSQVIPWPTMNHSDLRIKIINDLQHVSYQLSGEIKFTIKSAKSFTDFYNSIKPIEFEDEATESYRVSSWVQAIKLAMVLSVSECDDLIIHDHHMQAAIKRVLQVLEDIKIVFRSSGESDLAVASDRVLRFIETKGYASKNEILRHNWRHITSVDLDTILLTFVTGGLLRESNVGNVIKYEVIPQGGQTP